MSVEAITWALKQPVKQSTAKFVLVVLANCASADTFLAYPSVGYIVDATGQDRKTVIANLARLVDWGLIEDTGKRAGATRQIPVYRVKCGPDLFTEPSQKRKAPEKGIVPDSPAKAPVIPREGSRKRDTEPSGTVRKGKDTAQQAARFDDFWSAYPHKRGKKPAHAKWKAKRLDAQADAIIADVQRRITGDERWLRGIIPDPLTYLNQERWEDELSMSTPAVPRETAKPAPSESKLEAAIAYAKRMQHLGEWDADRAQAEIVAATQRHRGEARA